MIKSVKMNDNDGDDDHHHYHHLPLKGTSGHMVFQSSVIFVATPHFLTCLAYGLPSCVFFCFVLGFKVVAHF